MKTNRLYVCIAAVVSLLIISCAKEVEVSSNNNHKVHFDAWAYVNYPDAKQTPWGSYILSDIPGDGGIADTSEKGKYVIVDYTISDLDGDILSTSDEKIAKQLGTYSEENNYLPVVWKRSEDGLTAGLEEAVSTMRVGGNRVVAIPGWLLTNKRYNTAKEYLDNVEFSTNVVYDITLRNVVGDIVKWEIDSVASFVGRNFKKDASDSLKYGFYYIQEKQPSDTNSFKQDSTIYINYTGRLLNGKVFDTNIADTAKFYGIYDAQKTYSPSSIVWNKEDYTKITMGSSTPISGFAYMLSKMRHFEKGTAVFYSGLGYGTSGSGNSIPSYSPLMFDVEIVNKAK